MVHTAVCDLLGIRFPIIQAGMGPFTSPALVAAVSNAGGLGSLGAGARSPQSLRDSLTQTRELTNRPFAVNHTLTPNGLDEEAFAITLEAAPRLVSFAIGDPGAYVKRAHDAGALVMHQVTTVTQARRAADHGVDIIVAQGSESGGFGGEVAALALIPQVLDAVSPIPVIAAGGIADGRGLAAVLVLGAQGVNIGTRFLASAEAPIADSWKQAILAAESEDTIKVALWGDLFPATGVAYPVIPRTLHSPFVDEWEDRRSDVRRQAEELRSEVGAAMRQGTLGELFPFTGQTAGLIRDVLPAAEIVTRIVAGADEALERARALA